MIFENIQNPTGSTNNWCMVRQEEQQRKPNIWIHLLKKKIIYKLSTNEVDYKECDGVRGWVCWRRWSEEVHLLTWE
jgi:hypothetical protein